MTVGQPLIEPKVSDVVTALTNELPRLKAINEQIKATAEQTVTAVDLFLNVYREASARYKFLTMSGIFSEQ
jgi:hypothetical protein